MAVVNTAVLGGYGIVRAVSVFLGHFPKEFSFNKWHKRGKDYYVYSLIYFIFIVLFSLSGIYY